MARTKGSGNYKNHHNPENWIPRDQRLTVRLTKNELAMIDALCQKAKLTGKPAGRTDVIIEAVRHASGEIKF